MHKNPYAKSNAYERRPSIIVLNPENEVPWGVWHWFNCDTLKDEKRKYIFAQEILHSGTIYLDKLQRGSSRRVGHSFYPRAWYLAEVPMKPFSFSRSMLVHSNSNQQLCENKRDKWWKKFQQFIVFDDKKQKGNGKKWNSPFFMPVAAIRWSRWNLVDINFLLHKHNAFISCHNKLSRDYFWIQFQFLLLFFFIDWTRRLCLLGARGLLGDAKVFHHKKSFPTPEFPPWVVSKQSEIFEFPRSTIKLQYSA